MFPLFPSGDDRLVPELDDVRDRPGISLKPFEHLVSLVQQLLGLAPLARQIFHVFRRPLADLNGVEGFIRYIQPKVAGAMPDDIENRGHLRHQAACLAAQSGEAPPVYRIESPIERCQLGRAWADLGELVLVKGITHHHEGKDLDWECPFV